MLKECPKVAIICQDLGSADDLLPCSHTGKPVPSAIFCFCLFRLFFMICFGVFNMSHISMYIFTRADTHVETVNLA